MSLPSFKNNSSNHYPLKRWVPALLGPSPEELAYYTSCRAPHPRALSLSSTGFPGKLLAHTLPFSFCSWMPGMVVIACVTPVFLFCPSVTKYLVSQIPTLNSLKITGSDSVFLVSSCLIQQIRQYSFVFFPTDEYGGHGKPVALKSWVSLIMCVCAKLL